MRKRKKKAGERRRRAWGKGSELGGGTGTPALLSGVGVIVINHIDFVAANFSGGGRTAGGRGGRGVYDSG